MNKEKYPDFDPWSADEKTYEIPTSMHGSAAFKHCARGALRISPTPAGERSRIKAQFK